MMKFKLGSWPKYPTTERRGLERLTVKLRFRDQGTYSGSSATFLGHSLSASCFCISNQAFKRNLCVRTAAAVDC
jgi:hypothetical protein